MELEGELNQLKEENARLKEEGVTDITSDLYVTLRSCLDASTSYSAYLFNLFKCREFGR